jgi:hypothetical protein
MVSGRHINAETAIIIVCRIMYGSGSWYNGHRLMVLMVVDSFQGNKRSLCAPKTQESNVRINFEKLEELTLLVLKHIFLKIKVAIHFVTPHAV